MKSTEVLFSIFFISIFIHKSSCKVEPLLRCYECRACDKPTEKDLKDCNPTLAFPSCYTFLVQKLGIINRFCASAIDDVMKCYGDENDENGADCYCNDRDGCNYLSPEEIRKLLHPDTDLNSSAVSTFLFHRAYISWIIVIINSFLH